MENFEYIAGDIEEEGDVFLIFYQLARESYPPKKGSKDVWHQRPLDPWSDMSPTEVQKLPILPNGLMFFERRGKSLIF